METVGRDGNEMGSVTKKGKKKLTTGLPRNVSAWMVERPTHHPSLSGALMSQPYSTRNRTMS